MYCVLPHSGELTLREKAYFYGLLVGNFSWNAKVNQSGAASIPQIFSGENVSVVALKPQKESFFSPLKVSHYICYCCCFIGTQYVVGAYYCNNAHAP